MSNSDCPLWSHFTGTQYFHSACNEAIFCIRLSKPRPPPSPSCFHALVGVCKGGFGWKQQGSEDWKWHCYISLGAGGAEGRPMGLLQPLHAPMQSISRNTWWATSIVTLSAAAVVSRGPPQLIWWAGKKWEAIRAASLPTVDEPPPHPHELQYFFNLICTWETKLFRFKNQVWVYFILQKENMYCTVCCVYASN